MSTPGSGPSLDELLEALENVMRLAAVMSHLDAVSTLLKDMPNHRHLRSTLKQIGEPLVAEADRLGRVLATDASGSSTPSGAP